MNIFRYGVAASASRRNAEDVEYRAQDRKVGLPKWPGHSYEGIMRTR